MAYSHAAVVRHGRYAFVWQAFADPPAVRFPSPSRSCAPCVRARASCRSLRQHQTFGTLLQDYSANTVPNTMHSELTGHRANVKCICFDRSDGTRLLSGSSDNTVRVWNIETGSEVTALEGHTCGNFDAALGHVSRISQRNTTPHTPRDIRYLVPVLIVCCLLLAIRCYGQSTGCR